RRRVVRSSAHGLRHRSRWDPVEPADVGERHRRRDRMDVEGAVWCSDVGPDEGSVCLQVREGGEVLHRIELDRPCYAFMLVGEDGRTLFMVVARWFGPDRIDELQRARTGQVLAARVAVPHAGWP